MSFASHDAWAYGDMSQQSQGRRPSHNVYGPPNHPSGMPFTDSFNQPSPSLHIQTANLPESHHPIQENTTPIGLGPPFPGQGQESMSRYLSSSSDAPWTPAAIAPYSLSPRSGQPPMHPNSFTTPRSPVHSDMASSITGPHQHDSAYCSNASPTALDPITSGHDCPDIRAGLHDMKYPFSEPSESPSTPVKTRRGAPTSVPSQADEGNIVLPDDGKCPYCGKEPRLKSELKKHMLRHIRPFRCKIEDCNSATDGFTTTNDLDRHNRSVHGIFPLGAKVYICAARNCAEGEKMWPRYDNFKQHCERMHKSDGLEALITRSERQAPPPSEDVQEALRKAEMKSQSGAHTGAVSDTASLTPGDNLQYGWYESNLYGESETSSFVGWPPSLNGFSDDPNQRIAQRHVRNQLQRPNQSFRNDDAGSVSSARLSSQSSRMSHRMAPNVIIHQAENPKQRQNHDLAHIGPSQSQDVNDPREAQYQRIVTERRGHSALLTPVSANGGRSRSVSSGSSGSVARHQRGRSATVTGANMPSIPPKTSVKRKSDASNPSSSSKRVRCKWPGCNKADMRPCELKKHIRRHSRPFGCTFDFCHKVFGSKNDWKRHESSQHFQEEMWRCNQPYQPDYGSSTVIQSDLETTTPCALVFYEREEMISHLNEKHAIQDSDDVEQLCNSQHIGQNLQGSFWCGFCREVVRLNHDGRKGWDERFDHIGKHFHPEEKSIKNWLPPIGAKTKGQLQEQKVEDGDSNEDDEQAAEEDSEAIESPSNNPSDILSSSAALGISTHPSSTGNKVDPAALDPSGTLQSPEEMRKDSRRDQDIYCGSCGDGPYEAGLVRDSRCVQCSTPLQ